MALSNKTKKTQTIFTSTGQTNANHFYANRTDKRKPIFFISSWFLLKTCTTHFIIWLVQSRSISVFRALFRISTIFSFHTRIEPWNRYFLEFREVVSENTDRPRLNKSNRWFELQFVLGAVFWWATDLFAAPIRCGLVYGSVILKNVIGG